MSTQLNIFHRAGNWLNGKSKASQDAYVLTRDGRTKIGAFYQHGATLSVITGGGILIAGASIAVLIASLGHLPALMALLKASHLSHHTLIIASVAGTAGGGTVVIVHGGMLGLKGYAKRKNIAKASGYTKI